MDQTGQCNKHFMQFFCVMLYSADLTTCISIFGKVNNSGSLTKEIITFAFGFQFIF